jgi:FXSXX-COOH protein
MAKRYRLKVPERLSSGAPGALSGLTSEMDKMITKADTPNLASAVVDVHDFSLEELTTQGSHRSSLARIVPMASDNPRVAVAAFQSSL